MRNWFGDCAPSLYTFTNPVQIDRQMYMKCVRVSERQQTTAAIIERTAQCRKSQKPNQQIIKDPSKKIKDSMRRMLGQISDNNPLISFAPDNAFLPHFLCLCNSSIKSLILPQKYVPSFPARQFQYRIGMCVFYCVRRNGNDDDEGDGDDNDNKNDKNNKNNNNNSNNSNNSNNTALNISPQVLTRRRLKQ